MCWNVACLIALLFLLLQLDEYRPSWFTRISRAAVRMFETTWFSLTKEEALPLLSAIGTLLIIFFIGYGLSYASALEEKSRIYVSQVCCLFLFLHNVELIKYDEILFF